MYKLCVFAGTTEGRRLVEFLSAQPVAVTACVATEYGETLLPPAENLTVLTGRMDAEEMQSHFEAEHYDLVIDATHPYASLVTENLVRACGAADTSYLRLLREDSAAAGDAVFVADPAAAVDYLTGTQGTVFLTTGSKELAQFAALPDFADRVYARVLPMDESLRLCREAGLKPAHILAMQGPFTRELNVAMLRSVDAKYLVTKESGAAGGFEEKQAAAREAGAQLVVIGRPSQQEGLRYAQTLALLCERFGLRQRAQVTVVGIGPGSPASMTEAVHSAIAQADCVIGAGRMLEAVTHSGQTAIRAIAPEDIAAQIAAHPEHRRFVIAMSGDTGFYSGAKKLLPLLEAYDVTVLPGLSSLSCLCARLGTSYEDVVPVSVHGREHDILPDVRANARVFVLVGGDNGMGLLCRRLTEGGLGQVRVSVGERLSYPDETITVGTAAELAERRFQSLSAALIENAHPDRVVTHGLPDESFVRAEKIPMTKSEVRAVCLSKLRLTEHAVCWDVGAGTGSVAIEMSLQACRGSVYAIERNAAAVELLRENCRRLGAENVEIVSGTAPEACEMLPTPTHAFIGGSAGNMQEIVAQLLAKNPQVRIVATAITLESVAELTACLRRFAFRETEIISLSVARDRKAGPYHLMTGQNPIYIFTMQGGSC